MKVEDIQKVTAILRGYDYEQVRNVAEAMMSSNIRSMEITTNSPDAFETAKKISDEFKGISVGMGTIMNAEHVDKAIEAGVDFILTPVMLDESSIKKCKENNVVTVVSALTPSEVNLMFSYGADIVKIFPAKNVGYGYAKALKGPLGKEIKLMAVGGVSKNNVKDFIKGGYNYVGVGSSMFNKEDVKNGNIENLVKSLKEFENEMGVIDGK